MRFLRPRGLWGCTLIAATPGNLHRNVGSLTLRALARGAPALNPQVGRSARLIRAPNKAGPCMRVEKWGWNHRRYGRDRGWLALSLNQRRLLSLRGGVGAEYGHAHNITRTRETCLELSGLTCASCVAKVEGALLSVEGVLKAYVNLMTCEARVVVAANGPNGTPSADDLARATTAAGFPATVLWDRTTKVAGTRVVLDVEGLKCGSCVSKGEAALTAVAGVDEASINLATSTATVTFSETTVGGRTAATPEDLVAALSSQGYPAKVLRVSSTMDTGDSDVPGLETRVTPAQRHEREAVESRRRVYSSAFLLAVSVAAHVGHHAHHLFPHNTPLVGALGHTLNSLPAGWFDWLQAGIATAALAGPGSNLIRSGLASLRRLAPDMNSLVSTGVLAVYFASVVALCKPSLGLTATFHEPVMLLGAVLLGRSLEARQRLKAAKGLQGLFDVRPDHVRLVDSEGRVTDVPVASVCVGDTVEVLPGDRFSVDGVIITGRTAADESSLTGESIPISKGPGDTVRAGTSSAVDGSAVRVKATATGARSVLASVIALVEDAQARKAPVQRLADSIAGKFTWLVFASSASTLLFWGALSPWALGSATGEASRALAGALEGTAGGGSWALGMRLAVDVCLVACPCSLGLATPTAVMVGTGVAAERGLLLKGADVLETTKKATTVVFDKTGTLTTGKPTVTSVISIEEGWDRDRILEVAAAVERGCRHPLAEAVVSAAEKGLPERSPLDAEGLRTVPGMGASAQVRLGGLAEDSTEIHVGSPRYITEVCSQAIGSKYMERRLLSSDGGVTAADDQEAGVLSGELSRHLSRGETPIVVAVKGRAVGLLFSADAMRPAAATAVTDLARRGLNVRLASGDRKEAVLAAAVAAGVPTDNTSWGLTPADKASLVRSLQAQGEVVMVVGDGVNDAPALAAADVGVAMKAGTDVAMDTADIVLMRDDVGGAGMAVDVSILTMRKVRANLMWALGYNVIAIPLAAGVFLPGWGLMLSPALAGAIMSCSSVAVVTNSLLLRRELERKVK